MSQIEDEGFIEPGGDALGLARTFGTLEGETEQDESFAGEEQADLVVIGEDEDDDEQAEGPVEEEADGGTEEETAEEEEARLFAGRYPSSQALEKGYKDLQGGFTRVIQENRSMAEQIAARDSDQQALQARLDQLEQALLAKAFEDDPEFAEQYQANQAAQQMVDERVQAEVGPLKEQAQQQAQAQVEQQQRVAFLREAEGTIRGFWQSHEIAQGDETDVAMRAVLETLISAGVPVSPANPEHLEVVLEATQNPQIMYELANARPELLQIPGGLDFIRARAGATVPTANGSPAPSEGTQPKPRGAVRRRVESYVETGGGAPSGGTASEPPDEFAEAEAYFNRRFRSKGPLFGSAGG